jgi:hypothetical protein
VLCIAVNLLVIPAVAFFQIRHAWRGWRVIASLDLASEFGEPFNKAWFMRCWLTGGGTRELLRDKVVARLEHALRAANDDEAECLTILRIVQLPPFQDTETFGENGVGIVLEHLEETAPSFAVLKPVLASAEERGRSTQRPASSTTSGNQSLLAIVMQHQSEAPLNAHLTFINTFRCGMDVHHMPDEFIVETDDGRRLPFETVQLYALQQLIEKGRVRSLLDYQLDSKQNSWYATEYPVHFLMQSQLMNVSLLAALIIEAGAMALLQRDGSDK